MLSVQGLYSLSRRMSYRKISWSLEAMRFRFRLYSHSEIWHAPWQQCCRDAYQILEWYDNYNIQSCGLETSWDLVKHRTAQTKRPMCQQCSVICKQYHLANVKVHMKVFDGRPVNAWKKLIFPVCVHMLNPYGKFKCHTLLSQIFLSFLLLIYHICHINSVNVDVYVINCITTYCAREKLK